MNDSQASSSHQAPSSNATAALDRRPPDGLICFEVFCRLHQIPVDTRALIRDFALIEDAISPEIWMRIAKHSGFRCKQKKGLSVQTVAERYGLPAVHLDLTEAETRYRVVLKVDEAKEEALCFDPQLGQAVSVPFVELGTDWLLAYPRGLAQSIRFGLEWFFTEIMTYRLVISEVLLGSFIVQLFGLLTPLFTQVILDKVVVHHALMTLDVLGVAFIIITVFEFLLNIARQYIFNHTASKIDVKLGAKLFRHLFSLSFRYFETRKVGDILARVRELETIRSFVTQKAVSVIIDLIFSVVFLVMMALYSIKLTWIVMGVVALIAILYFVMTPVFRKRLEHKFHMAAENNSYLVESLTGVQTVKSLAIEGMMQKKWEDHLGNYVRAGFDLSKLQHITGSMASLFQRLMTLAILYLGVREVLEHRLTIGQLIAFNMFAGQFTGPVLRLVNLWHEVQQVLLGVDRVGDILNQPMEADSSQGITLPSIQGELTFENLQFRYNSQGPLVLDGINLTIPAGTSIGIVGRSGSGKSTLTKLAQRLYLATGGMILLDQVDVRQLNPRWLRYQLGVVLQENYLFSGTIRDNIRLPRPDAPMELVIEAARLAGAHEFITEMQDGYDSIVGERGASLSGGQRQRLAIARALITQPRILILDEATSALDYESERLIRQNLASIQQGRTVLIIAHRLSTVQHCTQIVVLDKGKLVEQGTHDELLALNGLYAYLYQQQQGEA